MSRLRAAVNVLRGRRWRDVADVLEAEMALVRAQLLVWTRPTGRLLTASGPSASRSPAPDPSTLRIAARAALALERAMRYGAFRPQCLVRAVALNRLLESHGIRDGAIRIGVRWAGGEFIAHAWVERGGVILGDSSSNTSSFVPLTDVRLSSGKDA